MATHTWFVKNKELYFKVDELNDKLDLIETCYDKNVQSEIITLESEICYIEETNQSGYHDLFRINNKSIVDNVIISKEECLQFINNTENKVYYHRAGFDSDEKAKEYWLSQIDEFWNKYPEGLIYFV